MVKKKETEFRLSSNMLAGGCFLCGLPGVTVERVIRAFGPPQMEPTEPEKGYDHGEWAFTNGKQEFVLYSRWNTFRVGGLKDPAKFVDWLLSKV